MIIKDTQTGRSRETNESENRDIKAHLAEYPKCDGSMIVDDHDQTLAARPYLQCRGCGVKVDPA
jgi:hypothetical protein